MRLSIWQQCVATFIALSAFCFPSLGETQAGNCELARPLKYSELRQYHSTGCLKNSPWPLVHEMDLNSDGENEVLLGVTHYSRGMDYALFTHDSKSADWVLISNDDSVASGHLGIEILKSSTGAWHDFFALQPDGKGGALVSRFTWHDAKYVMEKSEETPAGTQSEFAPGELSAESPIWTKVEKITITPGKRTDSKGRIIYVLNADVKGTTPLKGFSASNEREDSVILMFIDGLRYFLETGKGEDG